MSTDARLDAAQRRLQEARDRAIRHGAGSPAARDAARIAREVASEAAAILDRLAAARIRAAAIATEAQPGYDGAPAPAAQDFADALKRIEAAILVFMADDDDGDAFDVLLEEVAIARRARIEFAAAGARK